MDSTDPTIDLRSDTVTRPTPAMRTAIAEAVVGDDVFGDDPTVNEFQRRVASELGKESALFVPSGTMANQLAIAVQTHRGDQVVVESESHIYRYEAGAPAALSGVQLTLLDTVDGELDWSQVEPALNADDPHCAPPSLVCVENTHNRKGGRVADFNSMRELRTHANERGMRVHMDGARLWNAAVASGISMAEWASCADTVSVCFSKGMGAPIGSALVGDAATIAQAHRRRKQWGGGMRQAGLLTAACLHALDHHFQDLRHDHANARILAHGVQRGEWSLVCEPETNIVLFRVLGAATGWVDAVAAQGVHMSTMGVDLVRAVTHRDVSARQCEQAVATINAISPPRGTG